jgi:hypothetical protein
VINAERDGSSCSSNDDDDGAMHHHIKGEKKKREGISYFDIFVIFIAPILSMLEHDYLVYVLCLLD